MVMVMVKNKNGNHQIIITCVMNVMNSDDKLASLLKLPTIAAIYTVHNPACQYSGEIGVKSESSEALKSNCNLTDSLLGPMSSI